MLRNRWVWLLLSVGCVLVGGWWWARSEPADEAADRRARLRALRDAQTARERDAEQAAEPRFDLAELAAKGVGQPLPEGFRFRYVDDGDYWFVGHPGADTGVEIPFGPGQLAKSAADMEPVHENPGFVGAAACQECHDERYEGFVHTAHHRTSRPATPTAVTGSFAAGGNRMTTHDPNVFFTMVERDGQLYQRVSFYGWRFEVPLQIVLGSAKMGESYLYWHGDQLYQHNVTHLSANDPDDAELQQAAQWINSPGYIDGDAAYARPIPSRCLDCHMTYIDFREPPNHYTPESMILGVSCERCHGPGRDHVRYHQQHPQAARGEHIAQPSKLPRAEQLAICAQCHSGSTPLKGQPFAFRPGDTVEQHYEAADPEAAINLVHTSNQLTRLAKSACFEQSEMTCTACHNPHQNERGNRALFSERCLKCHESQACGMSESLGPSITANCIDCHMPKRAAEKLRFATAEGNVFPPLRDHHVRVDEAATKRFMAALEGGG